MPGIITIIGTLDLDNRELILNWSAPDTPPIPPDPPVPNGDIDLSNYTLTFDEQWTDPLIYETSRANDYGLMLRPWVPHYTAYANQYGSSGAIYDETGWMVDPRDPAMAPYNPFAVANGILSITTQPRPEATASLPLNNGQGNPCTWFGGALITMGTTRSGGFAQQYGYFEIELKSPPSLSGNFPAFWLLSATNRWPTEVDIYEMFGANHASTISPVLHSDPYWPSWSNADDTIGCVAGASVNVGVDMTQGFHRIGCDLQVEGITFYFDRKKLGTMPPYCGVVGLAITNPGSTVKADGGGATGQLRVKILSQWQFKNFAATLTITSGRVTAVQITQPGSCIVDLAKADLLLINNTGGSLGDAVLTPVLADKDPPLPLQYHTPLYLLLNFALGSFTGTPTAPATFQVKSVKVWKRNTLSPAILHEAYAETGAILDRITAYGGVTTHDAAINDLIAQLKSWKLRFDTVPMTPHTSDWDVTRLSLWDALDFLYLAGDTEALSIIDWKNPEADLIPHGNVSHEDLRGWRFRGGAGTYCDTGYLPDGLGGIRPDDHHLGVWLGDAIADPTLKTVVWAGDTTYLQASSTTHNYRSSSTSNAGGVIQKLAPGVGHLVMCRGWRYQHQSYHDGALFHAGYTTTAPPTYKSVVFGAHGPGYAGPDCRIIAAHGGRRLMPDEVEKLHQLIAEYFAALGVN